MVAVGGCGGDGGEETRGGDEDGATAQNGENGDASSATPTTPEGEPVAEEPVEVLAAREGSIDGERVLLEIVELNRSGETAALTFRLSLVNPDPGADAATGDLGAHVSSTFTNEALMSVADVPLLSVDGVALVDAENAKKYLVARDSEGLCVCDRNLSEAYVAPEAPLLLSATFGAPPDDVEDVDVVIPRFGTFKDVPIE